MCFVFCLFVGFFFVWMPPNSSSSSRVEDKITKCIATRNKLLRRINFALGFIYLFICLTIFYIVAAAVVVVVVVIVVANRSVDVLVIVFDELSV